MRRKRGKPPVCEICKRHQALYEAPLEPDGSWVNICKQCSSFFEIPHYGNEYIQPTQSGRIGVKNMFGKTEVRCPTCNALQIIEEEKQYTCECGVKVKI